MDTERNDLKNARNVNALKPHDLGSTTAPLLAAPSIVQSSTFGHERPTSNDTLELGTDDSRA